MEYTTLKVTFTLMISDDIISEVIKSHSHHNESNTTGSDLQTSKPWLMSDDSLRNTGSPTIWLPILFRVGEHDVTAMSCTTRTSEYVYKTATLWFVWSLLMKALGKISDKITHSMRTLKWRPMARVVPVDVSIRSGTTWKSSSSNHLNRMCVGWEMEGLWQPLWVYVLEINSLCIRDNRSTLLHWRWRWGDDTLSIYGWLVMWPHFHVLIYNMFYILLSWI